MSRTFQIRSESGKIVMLLALVLLIALGIIGFKLVGLYFDNATLKNSTEQICERALLEAGYDFRGNLMATVAPYGVRLSPDDIKYTLNDNRDQMRLSFAYYRILDLYVYRYPVRFSIDVTKEMAKARNIIKNFQKDYEAGSRGASERAIEGMKKENPEAGK